MSVGTCTLDFETKMEMKDSNDGIAAAADASSEEAEASCGDLVGVAGGEGSVEEGAGPHWMTSMAFSAR